MIVWFFGYSIGFSAFNGCSGFKGSLILPSHLESLKEDVFNGCSGFEGTLTIPEFVEEISKSCFLLTRFSKVIFNRAVQPNCKLNIGFPDGQIIYLTSKYHDDTFCSYETELLPSKKFSNNESEKSKKAKICFG